MNRRLQVVRRLKQYLTFNGRVRQREGVRHRLDILIHRDPFELLNIRQLVFVLFLLGLLQVELLSLIHI